MNPVLAGSIAAGGADLCGGSDRTAQSAGRSPAGTTATDSRLGTAETAGKPLRERRHDDRSHVLWDSPKCRAVPGCRRVKAAAVGRLCCVMTTKPHIQLEALHALARALAAGEFRARTVLERACAAVAEGFGFERVGIVRF